MVKLWQGLVLALLLLVGSAFGQNGNCGPPQCYSPCTDAAPTVDFVFFLDVSGSMAAPIKGVVSGQSLSSFHISLCEGELNLNTWLTGLTTFIDGLGTNFSPTFSLVIFGYTTNSASTSATSNGGAAFLDNNINAVRVPFLLPDPFSLFHLLFFSLS